ncbi:unnamed protein product [Medioppia subpectinata]|uniref:UDP-glucuronosyltransferase n=1 Tax=Medioppia subpectinata TaxID=1979941 RepID=A0A7R9KEM1_9ACAR|nr:unnamed protein product [Medioppia subpectinata]CAG2102131.1 unnamed protein product [Medioppia subpectinata]
MANNKVLKVLFVPILSGGHVYSSIGVAERLIHSGHEVLFLVNDFWSGKLTKYGIREVLLAKIDSPFETNGATDLAKHMIARGLVGGDSPLQKAQREATFVELWTKHMKQFDPQFERLLPTIQPDLIVLDQFMTWPSLELSAIPCVWLWGNGPLIMVDDEKAPPHESGLSATGDQRLWQEFRQVVRDATKDMWRAFNDWMVGRGCEPLPEYAIQNPSHYLNIYGIPHELDYQDIRPLGHNFVRFDNFKRTESDLTFAVPPELAEKPGALVYFSLGSFGAADVANMRRLLAILAKSPHRFIVSMGPLHNEYTLADNMWGEEWVPQIRVLPLVDLVITHAGINTVCETMFFGRPMIAMPLFSDQYDNSQQIQDTGFGRRLDAYKCSEEELLAAIETLLNDREMAERVAKVSRRIQTDNSLAKLPQIIEDFVQNRRKYIE